MEIFTLLETLEDIMERGKSLPFTERILVDKGEILDLIKEIRLKLPDELKQAKWIKEERDKIMQEARKDAEDIVKEAENRIISMIDEHEITKKAYDKKEEIIAEANEKYRGIVRDTNAYADDILANVQRTIIALSDNLANIQTSIRQATESAESSINEAKRIVEENRKELK